MKPSQFIYSEYIKEQKVQLANTNLMRKTDQEKYTSMSSQPQSPRQYLPNTSPIYSLVNLPLQIFFKEGQFGEMILPKSLTSYDQSADPIKVVKKNTEIARSLKKLKPIEQEINPDEINFTSESKNQKQKGPKHLVYLRTLNQLTGGLFKKTSSSLLFGSLEPKINQSTTLCVARIQELKFFNQYNQRNDKIPALFSWEALFKKKSLIKTSPKDFVKAQKDLLDFLHPRNSLEPAEIILWKIKNNDEKYIGQFEITTDDYKYSKEVLDYKSKFISETYVEKEMFRVMKKTKTFIEMQNFNLFNWLMTKLFQINILKYLVLQEQIRREHDTKLQIQPCLGKSIVGIQMRKKNQSSNRLIKSHNKLQLKQQSKWFRMNVEIYYQFSNQNILILKQMVDQGPHQDK